MIEQEREYSQWSEQFSDNMLRALREKMPPKDEQEQILKRWFYFIEQALVYSLAAAVGLMVGVQLYKWWAR